MTTRINVRALDPAGATDGQSPTYDAASGVVTWADGTTGGGAALAIDDEGAEVVAAATRLNFVGAGVTVTDAGSGEATVSIPGGGSGGGASSISFVESFTGNGSSFTWDPIAAQAGDLAILVISQNGGFTVTPPADWFLVSTSPNSGYYGHQSYIYAKVLDAADLDAETATGHASAAWTAYYLRGTQDLLSTVIGGKVRSNTHTIPGGWASTRISRLVVVAGTTLSAGAVPAFGAPYENESSQVTASGGAYWSHRIALVREVVTDRTGTKADYDWVSFSVPLLAG